MRYEVQEWDKISPVAAGGLVKGQGTAACPVLRVRGVATGIRGFGK